MKGLIIDKGEKFHSYFAKIFSKIPVLVQNYNWLVTNAECNPQNLEDRDKLNEKYYWLSGKELSEILEREDFQWIWGVLSGFPTNITLENILKSELPYADGYTGFWRNPITIQHPLAEVEIVAWDSTYSILISKNDIIIDEISDVYPQSQNLEEYNCT